MGIAAPRCAAAVTPNSPDDARTAGRIDIGTLNSVQSCGLHAIALMSKSIVRDALVGSVAWTAPSVSFQMSHVSIVPAASRSVGMPAARALCSSSHSSLVALK
jgi:hypothetical protein